MNNRGLFIVFEGGEGSGKTTQAKLLYEKLNDPRYKVFLTKEPGGDDGVCRDIRSLLLAPKYYGEMHPLTEFLIFEADRAQHVGFVLKPELAKEEIVIVVCDRYYPATFSYQCCARQVCTLEEFRFINRFATGGLEPDFTFWLDIDPEVGLKHNQEAKKRDRFEMEDVKFHQRVREGYQRCFEELMPEGKWQRLDASLSINELHNQILGVVSRLLKERYGF